jgi:hypothetical protein
LFRAPQQFDPVSQVLADHRSQKMDEGKVE